VPESQKRGMPEHERYEELCALAAGGLLEGADFADFKAHMKECSQCQSDYDKWCSLVARDVSQAQGTLRQKLGAMRAKPLPYSRQRFLRRARAEGLIFSREVETSARSGPWYFRPVMMLAPVALLIVIAASLTVYHFREAPDTRRAKNTATEQQIAELKRENSALAASRSKLSESVAAEQRDIQNLRRQLADIATTAETLRRNGEHSSSQNAQLLDESRNQEKLLAEARDEATRSSQLRINDEAALVDQQTRITELSNKLRIASATIDMERQLAAAGKDVRELLAARELHVIDVRDTDPNGKPADAFGRIFLTEGKSLTFYAFDLNPAQATKRSFQVWAVADSGKNSSRSLGFLHADAKAPGRWVLRVDNPELVKQISAVFIAAEPATEVKQPSTQKMLYAYLGEGNHP
jgi:hypothetical protein